MLFFIITENGKFVTTQSEKFLVLEAAPAEIKERFVVEPRKTRFTVLPRTVKFTVEPRITKFTINS